ncbi:CsgG/HfaB family protein [Thermodesulfatator atlanticus]|uniref:CsgG/HfaB family protein n=1 Tax=Thermodesulfatator atlanticus TaxID=501497 RepID=UPI000401CD0A|nr:CsgG/HfaB family protein [Thermodesulfatator atlanticus]
MRRFLSLVILFLLIFATNLLAKQVTVAILPFKINAKEDLSYVKQGIQDMLSTRLYDDGKVIVVDQAKVNEALKDIKEPITSEKARELGKTLGADYVVIGSLTSFGQKVSLDAKIIPVNENKPPFAVYTYANDLDDLVPKLDDFAKRGLAYLEGKPFDALANEKPIEPTPVAEPKALARPVAPPPADVNKMHPERVFRMEQPEASNVQAPQGPPPAPEVRAPKYSEVDSWPDYRPEEVAPQAPPAPQYQVQQKPKKKSFWSKLLPWNWFGRDEEEVIAPKGSVPPPPPPPQAPGTQATAPQSPGTPPPPPGDAQPASGAQAPSQGGKTWEWY